MFEWKHEFNYGKQVQNLEENSLTQPMSEGEMKQKAWESDPTGQENTH